MTEMDKLRRTLFEEVARHAFAREEAQARRLITEFPGLGWEIVRGDYEILFYRARQHDGWLLAKFSPDGTRYVTLSAAEASMESPAAMTAIIDQLNRELTR